MPSSILGSIDGHSRLEGTWLCASIGSPLPTFDGASDAGEVGCIETIGPEVGIEEGGLNPTCMCGRVGAVPCKALGLPDGTELGCEDMKVGFCVGDVLSSLVGATDGHSRLVGT
jgi:hypothetical protein